MSFLEKIPDHCKDEFKTILRYMSNEGFKRLVEQDYKSIIVLINAENPTPTGELTFTIEIVQSIPYIQYVREINLGDLANILESNLPDDQCRMLVHLKGDVIVFDLLLPKVNTSGGDA